ncbi:MAG: four helix bundle protein [Fimbriimonadaceae bacterium]|nr:four helix bundle protein [Fimbriimonadaceae bacterium]
MEGTKAKGGFKDLDVWQLARELVAEVYELTLRYPQNEQYGIISQLRRAAISIPSNIAEGWGRNTDASFAQFLRIARGSLNEVETLLILSVDLNLVQAEEISRIETNIDDLGRKLYNLTNRLTVGRVREEVATYGSDNGGF